MKKRFLVLTILLAFAGRVGAQDAVPPAEAPDPQPAPAVVSAPGAVHALFVCGINRDPEDMQSKARAVMRLRKTLVEEIGAAPDRVRVLADEASPLQTDVTAPATRDGLKAELDRLAVAGASDRVVFYFGGMANIVGESLRLNLKGPDVTGDELVEWLKPVAANGLLILDCPHAGALVEKLAAPNRMIVCSCRSDQPYATYFSDFFVPALSNVGSDANGDGRVSLLEAFRQACVQVGNLYQEQKLLKSENALLDDNGDGIPSQQPWNYRDEAGLDGAAADNWFLTAEAVAAPASEPTAERPLDAQP